MAYEYDVFFSYKRSGEAREWIRGLVGRLRFWLDNVHFQRTKLFFDDISIEAGERWPDEIRDALMRSRCMVCLWSPEYFRSGWCLSEWETFRGRQEIVHKALVAPLRFCDGQYFHPDAKQVETIDVSDFTSTVVSFWESQKAIQLDEILRKTVAPRLSAMIASAPEFSPGWPVAEEPKELTPIPPTMLVRL